MGGRRGVILKPEAEWVGKVFGRLTILGRGPRDKRDRVTWKARCTCGKEVAIPLHRMTYGTTKSCGCLQPDTAANLRRQHGSTAKGSTVEQRRTHDIWVGMRGSVPKSKIRCLQQLWRQGNNHRP